LCLICRLVLAIFLFFFRFLVRFYFCILSVYLWAPYALNKAIFFLFFFFFHTLYIWTVAFVSPLSLSFGDFFVRFSLSSYVFSLVYFWCTYERLTLLIRPVYYLSQKKKKNNSCTHMGTGLNLYGGDAIQSKDHWLISCITCLENNCISFGANYLLRTPEIKMQPYPLIRIQPARRINIV